MVLVTAYVSEAVLDTTDLPLGLPFWSDCVAVQGLDILDNIYDRAGSHAVCAAMHQLTVQVFRP